MTIYHRTIHKMKQQGFTLDFDYHGLIVKPFSKLTTTQLEFLKTNKAAIIDALIDHRRFCYECANRYCDGRCKVQVYAGIDDIPRNCKDFAERN